MRIVLIKWVDTRFTLDGWMNKDIVRELKACNCVAIGVIVSETRGEIRLSPILSEDNYAQSIVIPKDCIKSMKRLKVIPD